MPKMTRKDFEFIAEVLRESEPPLCFPDAAHRQWSETVNLFVKYLTSTNPQFNRTRFLDAAYGVGK